MATRSKTFRFPVLLALLASANASAAEIRIHGIGSIGDQDFEIQSQGASPRPSLTVQRTNHPKVGGARIPVFEFNTDTDARWHAYAQSFTVLRSGSGLVNKQVLLFGFVPVTVAIPADYELSVRSSFLDAAYKLVERPGLSAGISAGVGLYEANLSLVSRADGDNQSGDTRVALPMTGVFVASRLSDNVNLTARYRGTWLSTRHDMKRIRASHFQIGADWKFHPSAALGVAYFSSAVDYFFTKETYNTHYGTSAAATSVYLKYIF